jgi:AraC family transcriptional regulator
MDANTGSAAGPAIETPRLVEGRPMRLAGLKGRFTPETMREIPALWQRFVPMLETGAIATQMGRATWGMGFHCFDGSPSYEYRCAVEVTGYDGLPLELTHLDLPALRWAIFPHRAHVSQLGDMINAIWRRGLSAFDLVADHRPGLPEFLERYGEGFDPGTGLGDLEVWFPVRR